MEANRWRVWRRLGRVAVMDQRPLPERLFETERLEQERRDVAVARASVAAGLFATSTEVKAWIDAIGTDHPLAVPVPKVPRSR